MKPCAHEKYDAQLYLNVFCACFLHVLLDCHTKIPFYPAFPAAFVQRHILSGAQFLAEPYCTAAPKRPALLQGTPRSRRGAAVLHSAWGVKTDEHGAEV